MSTLEDEICQTDEDKLSGKFCECSHLIAMHETGEITKITKCFGMIFNGISLSKCCCNHIRPVKFEIKVDIYATDI